MFIRTDIAHANIGRGPGLCSVRGTRQIIVGHVALSGCVVASVVEGHIDIAGNRIDRHPVVETIDWESELVGYRSGR